MQIQLYIDEDAMARTLIQPLRARGVDVATVIDEGMKGRADEEQLAYATKQRRVSYTFNVGHFCRLHKDYLAQRTSHAGINSRLQAAIFSRRTDTSFTKGDNDDIC